MFTVQCTMAMQCTMQINVLCNVLCNVLYMQCTIYVIYYAMYYICNVLYINVLCNVQRKYAFPPSIMLLCFIPCPIMVNIMLNIPQKNYDYDY